jgi:polysaccharide deacetylase family protein (PEP-CTERM system associated)
MKHALSIDVEDWFQVLNMAGTIDRTAWDGLELRCASGTRRILDLLDRRAAKATFFFLGWIAERLPELVAEVHAAGHEVGSHGYDHRLLPELGAEGFRADLERTNRILHGITGADPTAFRACTWSITRRTPWAPGVLLDAGFVLDSSVFPVRHPDYGVPGAPAHPYRMRAGGGELREFPPLTWDVWGQRLPVGGGGYLRLLPLGVLRRALRAQERRGWPGCVYLHPWELDPDQPRQRLGGLAGFRHYVNLHRTESKLARLLDGFAFTTLSEALAETGNALPLVDLFA